MRMFSIYLFSFICLSGISHIRGAHTGDWIVNLVKICSGTKSLINDVTKMSVYIYDFQKNLTITFPVNKAAQGILSIDKLDKNKKFYVFVGGFKNNIKHSTSDLVRDTFKTVPNSYLIIIDHSNYTNDLDGNAASYKRSVDHVYPMGVRLAQMLAVLNLGGISAKNIHAIGHSLGSQILGYVGENFIKATGHKIGRITALDPAGPCFSNSNKEHQIRAGVAEYVEVYHCDSNVFGTTSVLGDIDFFVNKGTATQPQCTQSFMQKIIHPMKKNVCSHNICVPMWMSTVKSNREGFPAVRCNSYESFKDGKCPHDKNATISGFWNPGTAKGKYYFSTEKHKTF